MDTKSQNWRPSRTPKVAIVGAGMSGICMGIKLQQAGHRRRSRSTRRPREVGGHVAREHLSRARVRRPSRFYSYSFAPNPDWTQLLLARVARSRRYFDGVADDVRHARATSASATRSSERDFEDGSWQLRMQRRRGDAGRLPDLRRRASCTTRGYPSIAGPRRASPAMCSTPRAGTTRVALEGRRVGDDRHRLDRRPDHLRALARSPGRLEHIPAHGAMDLPGPNPSYSPLTRRLHAPLPGPSTASPTGCWQKYFEHLIGARRGRSRGWQRTLRQRALPPATSRTVRGPAAARKADARLRADVQAARHVGELLRGASQHDRTSRSSRRAIERVEPRGHRARATASSTRSTCSCSPPASTPTPTAPDRARPATGRHHARRGLARRAARLPHGRRSRASPTSSC